MQPYREAPSHPVRPSLARQLRRGVTKKCPRCGAGRIFAGFFRLKDNCPTCGYAFEREEGYWTGAMIVNIAACEAWFALLFVGTLLATLPEVDWAPLLGVALLTNGLLPIVFYPRSKTIWMALDLYWHPLQS